MKRIQVLAVGIALITQAGATTYGTAEAKEYRGGRIGTNRDTATVVFPNTDLSQWTPKMSWFRSSGDPQLFGASGSAFASATSSGNDGKGDGVYSEFQRWDNSAFSVCCVRVFFFQDGMDVKAYVARSYYSTIPYFLLGMDMSAIWSNPATRFKVNIQSSATDKEQGYGIDHILMERVVPVTMRPENYADIASSVKVGAESNLVLDDDEAFAAEFAGGTNSANFSVDGRLTVSNITAILTGAVSGQGTVEIAYDSDFDGSPDYHDDFIQKTYQVLVCNRALASLTNITCRLKGGNCPNNEESMGAYKFSDNGTEARWGIQRIRENKGNPFLVDVPLFLKQVGSDIWAYFGWPRIAYLSSSTENIRKYAPGGVVSLGIDLCNDKYFKDSTDYSKADRSADGVATGYGLHEMNLYFADAYDKVVLKGANLMATGGVVRVSGGAISRLQVSVENKCAIPSNGVFRVQSGADVTLNFAGTANGVGFAGDTARMVVERGGVLRTNSRGNYAIGHSQMVEIRGGTFSLAEGTPAYQLKWDSNCYCNFITFVDGGTMNCPTWARIGNRTTDSAWRVSGQGVATYNGGWDLVTSEAKDTRTLSVSVENTSGDEAPDFIVNGPVNGYDYVQQSATPAYRNMRIEKNLDGTVRFNGEFRPYLATRITGGALMLGVSGATTSEQGFILNGGSLAVADGTSNEIGAIEAQSSGSIVLGANSTLSVADCSAQTWAAGVRIDIVGDSNTSSLKFGTSSAALTAAQVRCLRWNGKRVTLDNDGQVVPGAGLVFVVR